MSLSFRYKAVKRPDGTIVKTPSTPITLHGTEPFNTLALLDSGADMSVLPLPIAEILGLDMSGEKLPAYGIGGVVESVQTKVVVTIEKGHEHYNFSLPVKIVLGKYDFPMLLGRAGFLIDLLLRFIILEKRLFLSGDLDYREL